MLHIENLTASIDGHEILKGLDLDVGAGEVHVIMGPNGAGKSTLSAVLAGRDGYDVTGNVTFKGADLLDLTPEARAAAGIFLAFQYPTEIPGVGNMYFLRTAVNAIREARGEPTVDARTFLDEARTAMSELEMDPDLLSRAVNAGFSGGEKKRNEILQMAMLQPDFAILDETDSGLDIDALRAVADGIERLRTPGRSLLIITHYPRLLDHVHPDVVHVLSDGRIIRSGGLELAHELEQDGYGPAHRAWIGQP
ncbi:Fe-S cluster assembly ATPase SufC [Aquihabitans daechungensis]|uniref:Fe-S cluster assembly ATPase SufC n=1 Tax=Aquihabitans daechungensis TaxID=1052257 RepID=UPI003BA11D16